MAIESVSGIFKGAVQAFVPTINDVTTGGVTSNLSAQQGVVLKGLIDTINTGARSRMLADINHRRWFF